MEGALAVVAHSVRSPSSLPHRTQMVPRYIFAQVLGAFCGALIIYGKCVNPGSLRHRVCVHSADVFRSQLSPGDPGVRRVQARPADRLLERERTAVHHCAL